MLAKLSSQNCSQAGDSCLVIGVGAAAMGLAVPKVKRMAKTVNRWISLWYIS
jgi:hypothetical protein